MTDIPQYEYCGTIVKSQSQIIFQSGEVEILLTPPSFTETVEVEVPNYNQSTQYGATVLLSGITVETDVPQTDPEYPDNYDPALGFTIRGLGVKTSNAKVDSAEIRFKLTGRFELGPADRIAMNKAIKKATVKMIVHYTVVQHYNETAVTYDDHGYKLEYPPPQFPFPQKIEPASVEQRRLEIQVESGMPLVIPGLTGFDFRLFESTENGDYIRKISVMVDLLEYNSSSGIAVLDVNGYASNSSIIAYETMENDFSANLALIQIQSGLIKQFCSNGSFETGRTTIPVN